MLPVADEFGYVMLAADAADEISHTSACIIIVVTEPY
jgi:hypothetical protein